MQINAGRLALVTGSTTGIGLAAAKAIARAGADMIINGRTQAAVDQAVAEVQLLAPAVSVTGIAADVSTAEGAAAIAAAVPHLDILVNNVGIYERKSYFQISDDDWRRLFEVNVLSGVRLARLYGEGMRSRAWGRIVFISSESGLLTPVDMIHYGVSKTAQIAVARGLAVELGGSGVTVNSVLPGPTNTEGMVAMIVDEAKRTGRAVEEIEKEFFDRARPTSLNRRFSSTDEIGAMIAFVCSEMAGSTTGASLRCDGGIVTGLG
ncbi:SDR family NAD(P)-dependent oxidoreductase [Acidisoma cellulosilytica]|uniref:SDR family NAD(P)-dependent oxidoreductase n=1 Tax=Acidisoma cellulosilyticum TaxID=2802395 RepID=A0A963Z292_9PROT|nr:SDR family NAD(P)-dependent oxidoreductase [Acidisoma cellulosilyticum]MCB8881518.1 SDR family NAD(P)-dependent oxidoreductase [Acidisoma cellulosilyticum]